MHDVYLPFTVDFKLAFEDFKDLSPVKKQIEAVHMD
jgi:hypothetical protein